MTGALRKKLLDLAIRGHLTASWRKELAWEGELPSGWKMVKLGEVGQVRMCKRILKSQTVSQGDIPFFKIGTFGKTPTSYITKDVFEEYVTKYPYPKRGDILISAAGTIGRVVVFDGQPAYFQDSNIVWLEHDNSKVSNQFLFWYYQTSPWKVTKGTTIPRLYNENILNADIPLPPLEEQKVIVKRLEELLALEKEIAADTAALDELASAAKRKILDLAIRGHLTASWRKETKIEGDLPVGWKMVKLGEVCDYGKTISVDPKSLKPDSWVLDLEDIEKDTGKLLARVSAKDRKSSSTKHSFVKGTLLYSKLRTYLNKVLIAPEDGCCTSEILPLVFNGRVNPEYARIVLMSPMFLEYTAMCCYGVKMPRLGTSDGRKAPFPLPPLEEQKAIVSKVEELLAAIEGLNAK